MEAESQVTRYFVVLIHRAPTRDGIPNLYSGVQHTDPTFPLHFRNEGRTHQTRRLLFAYRRVVLVRGKRLQIVAAASRLSRFLPDEPQSRRSNRSTPTPNLMVPLGYGVGRSWDGFVVRDTDFCSVGYPHCKCSHTSREPIVTWHTRAR